MMPEFRGWDKIPRLFRKTIITEKLDGTNGQLYVTDENELFVGSRNRWLTADHDNMGFYAWAMAHRDELITTLGPGRHFGEWFGRKIGRGYDMTEKRFALFNVQRWREDDGNDLLDAELPNRAMLPEFLHVVPTIVIADQFRTEIVDKALDVLRANGSFAAPGYMRPEGVIVFHDPSHHLYKVLLENDATPKGE